jgi:hypothetical protein
MNEEKKDLIDRIMAIELAMFLSVPSAEPAPCQSRPDEFKRNRKAQFAVWSDATLSNYLDDLKSAEENGRNLMTLKYARMGAQIPCMNASPLIDKIVEIQVGWQKEMFFRYPNLMRGARQVESRDDTGMQTSFETYLRGELETYSEKTLALLYKDVLQYVARGRSMNERLYENLVRDLGYGSLKEAENAAARG